ncbi:curli assembly protein CsgF [Flavobacterium sp. HJSW_4]|uniref:curli assembly protein CsgF n=1 Tax=Flavobacterium sp. HJSW_4 TaxID=3344660 RepID=UPI0035F294C5
MKTIALLVCLFGFSTISIAQNLAYKAANPNFGGETFNYPWLLSSAQAQNDYKEQTNTGYKQQTDLERFKSNLNNQLLNRLSNSLFENQFGSSTGTGGGTGTGTGTGTGSGSLSPGTYVFGTLSVDIYHSNLGLVVDVLDTDTGEQTQVILPGQ